jgi:hypothetical protein
MVTQEVYLRYFETPKTGSYNLDNCEGGTASLRVEFYDFV